jgi:hypothetical protein
MKCRGKIHTRPDIIEHNLYVQNGLKELFSVRIQFNFNYNEKQGKKMSCDGGEIPNDPSQLDAVIRCVLVGEEKAST